MMVAWDPRTRRQPNDCTRMRGRLRRLAWVSVLLLAACSVETGPPVPSAPLSGESEPTAAASATPTGVSRFVDVGGHRLWMECQGTGSPAVVLEGGLGVYSGTWFAVMPAVASGTRVCRYDRAGLGQSDAGPKPRTSRRMVTELHTLLTKAHVSGPYVLVGHSLAGLNVHLYASTYPKEVAGLVLVDAVHPDLDRRIEKLLSARQVAQRRADLELNQEGIRFADILTSEAQVRVARPVPDVPLVVLRHGLPFEGGSNWPTEAVEKLWAELQNDLAKLTPRSQVIVAAKSHHRIQEDEPGVVSAAIEQVVRAARK